MPDHDEAMDQRVERVEAECANRSIHGCHPMQSQAQARGAEIKLVQSEMRGEFALVRQELQSGTALIRQDIVAHVSELCKALKALESTAVSREEFKPVRTIVYGMVATILVAVLGGLLALVVKAASP